MKIVRREQQSEYSFDGDTRLAAEAGCVKWIVARLPPNTPGALHAHAKLIETALILRGQVEVCEKDEGREFKQVLYSGDVVVFDTGRYHKIANKSSKNAVICCLKVVHPGVNDQESSSIVQLDWIKETA